MDSSLYSWISLGNLGENWERTLCFDKFIRDIKRFGHFLNLILTDHPLSAAEVDKIEAENLVDESLSLRPLEYTYYHLMISNGNLILRATPRSWSKPNCDFRANIDELPDGVQPSYDIALKSGLFLEVYLPPAAQAILDSRQIELRGPIKADTCYYQNCAGKRSFQYKAKICDVCRSLHPTFERIVRAQGHDPCDHDFEMFLVGINCSSLAEPPYFNFPHNED